MGDVGPGGQGTGPGRPLVAQAAKAGESDSVEVATRELKARVRLIWKRPLCETVFAEPSRISRGKDVETWSFDDFDTQSSLEWPFDADFLEFPPPDEE